MTERAFNSEHSDVPAIENGNGQKVQNSEVQANQRHEEDEAPEPFMRSAA